MRRKTDAVDMAKLISACTSPLQRDSMHVFAEILVRKQYKKGSVLLNEGDTCNRMLFIEKGMLRQYYFKKGKDMTEHIAYEHCIVMCIESYFLEEPTRLMIEALENTVVWEIPKEKVEKLIDQYEDIERMYRKFLEVSLIDSQKKADQLRFESAQERYLKLKQSHPEILRRAPLVYIASFLQMTPETLSRVRSLDLLHSDSE